MTRCLTIALWLAGGTAHAADPKPAAKRADLAEFTLKSLGGKRLGSAALAGKVGVVSFWATWCAPCKQELGLLEQFRKRYAKQGLAVLAIATDGPETVAGVRSVARRKRWRISVLLDTDGQVNDLLNPRGSIPYTVFVDRKGRIAHVHAGYKSGDESTYVEIIEKLLAEPAP